MPLQLVATNSNQPVVWKKRINIGTLATMMSVRRDQQVAKSAQVASCAPIAAWELFDAVISNSTKWIYPTVITTTTITTICITPKDRRIAAVSALVSTTLHRIQLYLIVRAISTVM